MIKSQVYFLRHSVYVTPGNVFRIQKSYVKYNLKNYIAVCLQIYCKPSSYLLTFNKVLFTTFPVDFHNKRD